MAGRGSVDTQPAQLVTQVNGQGACRIAPWSRGSRRRLAGRWRRFHRRADRERRSQRARGQACEALRRATRGPVSRVP
jgi:hypothetical protein